MLRLKSLNFLVRSLKMNLSQLSCFYPSFIWVMLSLLIPYIHTCSVMGNQLWRSLWISSNERIGPDHSQVHPRYLIFWDFAVTLPSFCRDQIQGSWFWSEATVEDRCPALPRALGSGVPSIKDTKPLFISKILLDHSSWRSWCQVTLSASQLVQW